MENRKHRKNWRLCFQCVHRVLLKNEHDTNCCKRGLGQDQSMSLKRGQVAVGWAEICSHFTRRKDNGIG